jgi:hypothetical protein
MVRPAGVVQLVERLLAKEKVMGSNPTARSGRRLLIVDFTGITPIEIINQQFSI